MRPLSEYRSNVTSEDGADGILSEIFNRLSLTQIKGKTFVEFGAADGKYNCNTWSLANGSDEWRGVYLEPSKSYFKTLYSTYKDKKNIVCINDYVSHDGANALDNILASHQECVFLPDEFDLCSIDVDGNDYHIWCSMKKYNPKIVVIENNGTFPPYMSFIGKAGNTDTGSSALALVELGRTKGYELVAHTEANCFFVRKDLYHLMGIEDNSLTSLFSYGFVRNVVSTFTGLKLMIGEPTHGLTHFPNTLTSFRKRARHWHRCFWSGTGTSLDYIITEMSGSGDKGKVEMRHESYWYGAKRDKHEQ